MFKFLKLRNSVSGDARRHVPFTSIIHKPIFIVLALLFSFVSVVPVKVKALADPVPQFDVINGTDLNTFIGGYNAATSDIQWITNALIGAQVLEYSGLGSYKISFDKLPDDADVWDRIVLIGERFTDELMYPYVAADRVFSKIIDYAQGALNFAKSFSSKLDFLYHVNNLNNFFVKYESSFGDQINQFFAIHGGLYNWQNFSEVFTPNMFSFIWNTTTMSGNDNVLYYNAYNSLPSPIVVGNNKQNSNIYNFALGGSFFNTYKNIYVNTSNNTVYLCDDSGVKAPSQNTVSVVWYWNGVESFSDALRTYTISLNNYSNLYELFTALDNDASILLSTGSLQQYDINLKDFVTNLYVGDSWSDKSSWSYSYDLGFSNTDSLQVLNPDPDKELLFDIKALVEQIVQAQPDPNYELPLQPIIYNVTQVNGSPLTAEDLQGISFNVTPPESGIDVPVNVFLPFFDDGKGFITYMWYMTKPLVSYTRSFLDTITFDPVDGFNASGPGYFILGVVAIGLIGGVVVKFLL